MTREEAREELKAEWEEFISGSGLTGHEKEEADKNPDFKRVYEANMMAIKTLEQASCDDCISRHAVLDTIFGSRSNFYNEFDQGFFADKIRALPPVTPQTKIGRWVLTQRDKYIDVNCSECGNTRIEEYAYNYTVDEIDMQEIKDLVVTSKMNYCECCGAKMEAVESGDKK